MWCLRRVNSIKTPCRAYEMDVWAYLRPWLNIISSRRRCRFMWCLQWSILIKILKHFLVSLCDGTVYVCAIEIKHHFVMVTREFPTCPWISYHRFPIFNFFELFKPYHHVVTKCILIWIRIHYQALNTPPQRIHASCLLWIVQLYQLSVMDLLGVKAEGFANTENGEILVLNVRTHLHCVPNTGK